MSIKKSHSKNSSPKKKKEFRKFGEKMRQVHELIKKKGDKEVLRKVREINTLTNGEKKMTI